MLFSSIETSPNIFVPETFVANSELTTDRHRSLYL